MSERIALLSNVNITPVGRSLQESGFDVWEPAGFGDILGPLLSGDSGLSDFDPTDAFIIVDLAVMVRSCRSFEDVESEVKLWFKGLRGKLKGDCCFYISDGVCQHAPYFEDRSGLSARRIESCWNEELRKFTEEVSNAYVFPYSDVVYSMGFDSFFSSQLWYLARIPYTSKGQNGLVERIAEMVKNAHQPSKKVMVVDLDNTLWGGVVGEVGAQGIELSDEHSGLAYKDVQRVLRAMADAGVILCVSSKNNYEDVAEVFSKNASMVLSQDDIVASRINWNRKDQSLRELSEELNLGIDSLVFLDDNPAERALISEMLPEVLVVDFPSDITQLPSILHEVFENDFKQQRMTTEDKAKAKQYQANAERSAYENASDSFEEYLEGLQMKAWLVDSSEHVDRITQLIGKTNQFNMTTKRYSRQQVEQMIESSEYDVYAFDVVDRFGDNGITAVIILDLRDDPLIDSFLMSCRIMGRCIEESILDFAESRLAEKGFNGLEATYIPTEKNAAVKDLYANLGYGLIGECDGEVRYRIDLSKRPERKRYVEVLR